MEKVLLLLALVVATVLQGQNTNDSKMKEALALWNSGENDKALATFGTIAEADTVHWLPHYYVALLHATSALNAANSGQVTKHLVIAEKTLQPLLKTHPENVELLVVQALIFTGWIVQDPMVNGRRYQPAVEALYARAISMAPKNPRVVLSKAQYDLGKARFFGTDQTAICDAFEKAKQLFDTFIPKSDVHPNWGKSMAEEALSNCS